MHAHEKINYVEFPATDIVATNSFFQGKIVKPIFSFPGGRRFHFTEPSGNEFAVWGTHAEH